MPIPARLDDLSSLEAACWQALQEGAQSPDHPWSRAVLGTVGIGSEQRMVVLRNVSDEERWIECHTDLRSAKIAQIQREPRVSWLFYDSTQRVQLSVRGTATVHSQDEIARKAWNSTRPESRRLYLAPHAPGTPLPEPDVNLPEEVRRGIPTEDQLQPGWVNFVVIRCQVSSIDWLWIQSDGNLRARFVYDQPEPAFSWIAP